jgi:peptide/nickel transport system substrate-binding protein
MRRVSFRLARLRRAGFAFVASCAVGVLLVACTDPSARGSRALVVGQASDPASLDPALTTSSEAAQILAQIYEPLVRRVQAGARFRPCLAVRWRMHAGGLRWTFDLRQGVRFHDGKRFDADAVVYSFERQRDRSHPHHNPQFAYWGSAFRHIVAVKKVSRYRIEMQTRRPYAQELFLANLAMYPVSIVSPRERALGKPIGTGPYKYVSWRSGARVVLERNTAYWGGAPRVRRLVFAVVSSEQQRLNGLQSGTIDLIYGVQPDDRPLVRLHPDLRLMRTAAPNVAYLAFNTRKPPFDRVEVRRAINKAVDKRVIIKLGYRGLGQPARGAIPPHMAAYAGDTRRYPFRPDKARQELVAAGFPGERTFVLRVMSTPRPYLPSPLLVARIIERNLRNVGVKVKIVAAPHAEHLAALRRGEHDLALLGWVADNGDADNLLYVLLDSDSIKSGQNIAFFRDPAVHTLLLAAQQETDNRKRLSLYQRAQRLIADQAPWVPLAHAEVAVALRARLRGVVVDPANTLDFRGVSF